MNRSKSLFFFFYVYSLPLFLVFCLSSCNKSQNRDAINSFEKRKREKINRYEKILMDKKIKSFEKIIKTEPRKAIVIKANISTREATPKAARTSSLFSAIIFGFILKCLFSYFDVPA